MAKLKSQYIGDILEHSLLPPEVTVIPRAEKPAMVVFIYTVYYLFIKWMKLTEDALERCLGL